ncbi:hydrogenase nickel incorporation protein HypB [candidate division KSB1 bacterium]|nr:hydrogenase nickel incorporation protein HypB [candidate division KSB1 bacterium]
MSVITIERKILKKNDQFAMEVRDFCAKHNILVLNLLSSPGSGKTTILEKTLARIKTRVNVAVIEGDVQTDQDAVRIARQNVPVVQIVTNGGCHLDAALVLDAVSKMDLSGVRLLFIENVGNLVCPSGFDLGEHHKIVIASTAEGDDKPLKYPKTFRVSDVCLINKIDLLPYLNFDVPAFLANAKKINPDLTFFQISAQSGEGLDPWIAWLESRVEPKQ